jgi:hypothetical protein
MTQPVLFKQSFLIAILAGVQAVLPAVVAVASLYATSSCSAAPSIPPPPSSSSWRWCVWCWCSRRARSSAQLTSPRVSAVVDVIIRWLLMLAVLLAIGYLTKSTMRAYPRRVFLTWAVLTPVALIIATLGMQELMRRFMMRAFEFRSAIFAGYNNSSLELARRLKNNPHAARGGRLLR